MLIRLCVKLYLYTMSTGYHYCQQFFSSGVYCKTSHFYLYYFVFRHFYFKMKYFLNYAIIAGFIIYSSFFIARFCDFNYVFNLCNSGVFVKALAVRFVILLSKFLGYSLNILTAYHKEAAISNCFITVSKSFW